MKSVCALLIALVGACTSSHHESSGSAIKATVADLALQSQRFAGKRVRVQGVWGTRMEESRLLPLDKKKKVADIWLGFAPSMQHDDPVGRKKVDEAFRDFNLSRNYFDFYFVRLDCEGLFEWDKTNGFGHMGVSKGQLTVDRVFEAERIP